MGHRVGFKKWEFSNRKIQFLVFSILILLIFLNASIVQAGFGKRILKHVAKNIGRNLGKKIVKDVRHDRNQIKKEVCKLFKELIIKKKFRYKDLELFKEFIEDRLPKNWKPKREYESLTEEVGYELIDPALNYEDYKFLRDLLNTVWNTGSIRGKMDIWKQIRNFRIGVFPVTGIAL